jgi:predicted nuclease with TOPRIM domain
LSYSGSLSPARACSVKNGVSKKLDDLERRIGLQVQALETGLEPQLVGKRIAELRAEKERLEAELAETGSEVPEASFEEIADALKRLPDLSKELRNAPPELKRQVFEAFCLEVRYDKVERRIELSATVSEAVVKAFENAEDLPEEVPSVTSRDIAGARYVPPSDARVVERLRLAA